MESQKKQNKTTSRRSQALLPQPSKGKGFPSPATFLSERKATKMATKKRATIKSSVYENNEWKTIWLDDDGFERITTDCFSKTKEEAEQKALEMANEYLNPKPVTTRGPRMTSILIDEANEEPGQKADASLERASQMSKAELFLRELQATDEDDYKVLSDRIAALVEEVGVGMKATELTLYEVYSLTNKIEEELQQKEIDEDIENRHQEEQQQLNPDKQKYEISCDCGGFDKDCSECDGTGYTA